MIRKTINKFVRVCGCRLRLISQDTTDLIDREKRGSKLSTSLRGEWRATALGVSVVGNLL